MSLSPTLAMSTSLLTLLRGDLPLGIYAFFPPLIRDVGLVNFQSKEICKSKETNIHTMSLCSQRKRDYYQMCFLFSPNALACGIFPKFPLIAFYSFLKIHFKSNLEILVTTHNNTF
jgi:hypothetical protein